MGFDDGVKVNEIVGNSGVRERNHVLSAWVHRSGDRDDGGADGSGGQGLNVVEQSNNSFFDGDTRLPAGGLFPMGKKGTVQIVEIDGDAITSQRTVVMWPRA